MGKIKLFLACILVGVIVAITYFVFEGAVRLTIDYIWQTMLNTNSKRLLVLPLIVVLTLVYFGIQHFTDPNNERKETHGLGVGEIETRLSQLGLILMIGYFSLVAGASLGPEAILIPACVVAGGFIGSKLFSGDKKASVS